MPFEYQAIHLPGDDAPALVRQSHENHRECLGRVRIS